MTIRQTLKDFYTSGNIIYATVENYANGLATVKMSANGQRLTNLPATAPLSSGQSVLVDYSSGIPPIVQPLIISEENISPILEEATETGVETFVENEVQGGFSVYCEYDNVSFTGTWKTLFWTNSLWDDDGVLNAQRVTIAKTGMYIVTAQVAANNFSVTGWASNTTMNTARSQFQPNDNEYIIARIVASSFGVVGINQCFALDTSSTEISVLSVGGVGLFEAGEILDLQVYTKSSGTPILVSDGVGLYPKLTGQKIDFTDDEAGSVALMLGAL